MAESSGMGSCGLEKIESEEGFGESSSYSYVVLW